MTCLKKFDITNDSDQDADGLLKVLQQLSHSNVTTMSIIKTCFCRLLDSPQPHDYYSALKKLVCPTSGKLEELSVGESFSGGDDNRLASLVSAPSSLKSLVLYCPSLSGHISYLKNNTCLTKLTLWYAHESIRIQGPHIAQILEHNKTLQHLELMLLYEKLDIDAVRTIVCALPGNNTLQSIVLRIGGAGRSDDEVSSYMRTHHEELTMDPRIHYETTFDYFRPYYTYDLNTTSL